MRQGLYAIGKSNEVLKLEIIRSILFIVAVIAGTFFESLVLAIFSCVAMYISTFLYVAMVNKLLPLHIKRLFISTLHTLALCLVMYGSIRISSSARNLHIIDLVFEILIGITVYVVGAKITKHEMFSYILSIIISNNIIKESYNE
ncbi:hypothetical protein SDC9_77500 [bioreactor metagenome]|uniref:Polysaccharide biosynthesis protein C-terminal domain-containing protein n=1 Tax=bioreactor metagenome TaxID=1076179 RepID=A0A644YRM0_9ZZZZ